MGLKLTMNYKNLNYEIETILSRDGRMPSRTYEL